MHACACRYLANTGLVTMAEDETRLAASAAEYKEWQTAALAADPAPSHHFICECFYMTARAIHIGFAKMIDTLQGSDMRTYQHLRSHVSANDNSPQGQHVRREVRRPCSSPLLPSPLASHHQFRASATFLEVARSRGGVPCNHQAGGRHSSLRRETRA